MRKRVFGFASLCLLFGLVIGPASAAQQSVILRGTVRDAAGGAVSNARVVLLRDSSGDSRSVLTDGAGKFGFIDVGMGTFSLTASLGVAGSASISVVVSTPGEQPQINLILRSADGESPGKAPAAAGQDASRDSSQTMQFADKPDFAIAAVTDWTAAGGHGSDSSLRTSEALTRDAVKLGSGDGTARATTDAAKNADLHRLNGELEEKRGDPLSAVHEFQQAASIDPSEENYFAWGSELLVHRAVWQAKEVFDVGAKRYPQSARMLTARGAALFAGALYDDAALDLCKASDLNLGNVETYLFMGKIEIAAPNPLPCVVEKLARFQRLQPENSLANYYYAMALKKQVGHDADPQLMEQVKDFLTRAVTLDPKCADGFLELGNLGATNKQWEQAIGNYQHAIDADPDLSDAHYRLGIAYQRTGEQDKAKEQFQLHDAIASRQAAEIQRQREAVKQFLVTMPDLKGASQAK